MLAEAIITAEGERSLETCSIVTCRVVQLVRNAPMLIVSQR